MLLLSVLACDPGQVVIGDPDTPPPEPAVAIAGPAAVDPLFGLTQTYTLAQTAGDAVTVTVVDSTGATIRTLVDGTTWVDSVGWDGRDDAGLPVATGGYTLHAALGKGGETVATATADAPVQAVRVGVSQGTLGGDRIALCWHRAGGSGMYWDGGTDTATFVLSAIDDGSTVTPLSAPWDDLDAPPEDPTGQNMPAAYAWDARPMLSLVVAGDVTGVSLTPRIAGWTLTSGSVAPGETLTFTADSALATGPGVVEPTLSLEWLAGDAVIGTQDIPLRMYALLGPPAFEESDLPYAPWVAVIDPALRSIAGVEPTEEAVASALTAYIYDEMELSYDTRWGSSAYTQYDGNTFNNAHFDLSSFLNRRRGSVVNCTDCAAILEAHANMVGAALYYTIISPDFDLNEIRAIGADDYTRCPFGGSSCGFSYHAVTTPDEGGTIYDATLLLDGDDDPGSSPSTDLYVQAITGDEYLERLVMSPNAAPECSPLASVCFRYTQKESIQ